MMLVLLDRDGVVVVNRATNIKAPPDLALVKARRRDRHSEPRRIHGRDLHEPAGGRRGIMSEADLHDVHAAPVALLGNQDAIVDRVFSCTSSRKCPRRKPAAGMLREALKAAFDAGCRRILVRTTLGAETLADRLPNYVRPVEVHDDLPAAARAIAKSIR